MRLLQQDKTGVLLPSSVDEMHNVDVLDWIIMLVCVSVSVCVSVCVFVCGSSCA